MSAALDHTVTRLPPRSTPSIGDRLDRLPPAWPLWRLVILLSLGGWFELYELFFTGYIAPGLTRSGILTGAGQNLFGFQGLGAFIAATFAGLFIGTSALGFLSDRYGRRFVFTYALLFYSAASVVMAMQTTAEGLLAWRFIGAIGVGVEIVTIDAYLTEMTPARMRGRAFALNQAIMFSAVPVAAGLAWILVPKAPFGVEGWRWVVVLGAVDAVVVWFLRRALPESPRWLALSGDQAGAVAVTVELEQRVARALDRPLPAPVPSGGATEPVGRGRLAEIWQPPYRGFLILLILFNTCQVIGYYGFANWVPTLLIAKGILVTKSLNYSFIIAIANPLGPLLAISFADRVERKWVIVGAAIGVALIGSLFSVAEAPPILILCGVGLTLINTILSYAYHAYQTEIFPVRIRARAAGIAYSASRVSAIASGFLVEDCLARFGANGVFALIIGCMVAVVVLIGGFGPRVGATH